MDNLSIKIEKSLDRLKNWIEKNGWASYDPNDIQGHTTFLKLLKGKNSFQKILLFFLYSLCVISPVGLRRILKIQPNISAGGMGFLASGYIELYKTIKDPQNLKEVKRILDWLTNNHIKAYKNYCWGFPFDWQSVAFIPKNTPIAYTTIECAKPFVEYYKITTDKKCLDIAISACEFISENINKKQYNDREIVFSYTPLDDAEVINSNAIIASVFLEVGQLSEIKKFIALAKKIILFVIQEQLADGSWYYFSRRYKQNQTSSAIDNYHTAMVLQSLAKIIQLEPDREKQNIYLKSLNKGLNFYLKNLFTSKGMPKMTPSHVYPIDIASCAEAITLFSQIETIEKKIPNSLYRASQKSNEKLVRWTIDNMRDKNETFIFRKYRLKKIKLDSIRWGQAFMLRALAMTRVDQCS